MCQHRSGLKFVQTNLNVLVSRCFVQITSDDCLLTMHDQLRDLAYRIVREEGSNTAQRKRLLGTSAKDVLKITVQA